MFQPQKIYLDPADNFSLTFDTFTDIQPLASTEKKKMETALPNNESEAMNSALGVTFNVEQYLTKTFHDKKNLHKARMILNFLTSTVDSSLLRFNQAGGIFYQGSLVPNADLGAVLKSLAEKKNKQLVVGEYFLLSNLSSAPSTILGMVNPSKLKLCNIQQTFAKQGNKLKSNVQPIVKHKQLLQLQPKPNHIQVRTAKPLLSNSKPVLQTGSILTTKKMIPTYTKQSKAAALQKRFTSKAPSAWYKVL